MYFLKVLPINARGVRKISVRANVADKHSLIFFLLSFDSSLSCKLQLIDLSAACLAGR